MSIIADLRGLIGESGMSRNAIAGKSGVSVAVVSRLLSGERPDLTTATAERIADAIGCELIIRRRPGKGGARSGKA